MKHSIDYASLSGSKKIEKAIEDTKWFLGEQLFDNLIAVLKEGNEPPTAEQVAFVCSMVGVQGYPAQAIYETISKD
jgi:hypothetical protein